MSRSLNSILMIAVMAGLMSPAVPAGATAAEAGEARPASAAPSKGITIEEVLKRFDQKQRATDTLVASFTERKNLRLLAEPVVSSGEFFFNRPNQVRWEYLQPDRKVFVITEKKYVAYYPALKKAEEVAIKKFIGKRLFRFLGVGQSIEDLARYYEFQLAAESDLEGTHLLLLTPRKKRVRERVAEMKIWVDAGTFLPRQLEYMEADGDSTLLAFHDVRVNTAVSAERFRIDIPQNVAVSQTFNGFSLGQRSF